MLSLSKHLKVLTEVTKRSPPRRKVICFKTKNKIKEVISIHGILLLQNDKRAYLNICPAELVEVF